MKVAPIALILFTAATPAVATDGSERAAGARALTDATWSSRAPAWSPDGRRIAFEQQRDGRWSVHLLSLDTGAILPAGKALTDERHPAWSPDGRRLLTACRHAVEADLCVRDLATGALEAVIPVAGGALWPDWSADGTRIALGRQRAHALDVLILDYRPGSPVETIATLADARWPRWAPDGRGLVYFSRRDNGGADDEVYVLDRVAGDPLRLTHRGGHDFCPDWSPTGRQLVVVGIETDGSRSLRILDVGGREVHRFAEGFRRVTEPAWSPEGRPIAYAAITVAGRTYRVYVEPLTDRAHWRPVGPGGEIRGRAEGRPPGRNRTAPASASMRRMNSIRARKRYARWGLRRSCRRV